MRVGRNCGWWLITLVAGCCAPSGGTVVRHPPPTAPTIRGELPQVLTTPAPPVLDDVDSGPSPSTAGQLPPVSAYRLLTATECQKRAAAATATANYWDALNRQARSGDLAAGWRYYAALEARNQASAEALVLYYQLAAWEAQRPLFRQALEVVETLQQRAEAARQEKVPYPVDPEDVALHRLQLLQSLDEADSAIRLLNVELKRRLGWPAEPITEHLWPVGDFAVSPETLTPPVAATLAEQDRPELRGWRWARDRLNAQTLPQWHQEVLGLPGGDAEGQTLAERRWSGITDRLLHPWTRSRAYRMAEESQRQATRWRQQIETILVQRSREVADEARSAAILLVQQTHKVAAARERLRRWDSRLREALRKREARQPNAELYELQVRWQRLLAEAELINAVAAWHQARVRLRAALGWYAYDHLMAEDSSASPPRSGPEAVPPAEGNAKAGHPAADKPSS